METRKLYYEDPFQKGFATTVVSCDEVKGGYAVVLAETAFYPEGGGQPYDTGVLGEANVLEVHEKNGVITHLCDKPFEVGKSVSGKIDWARRFDHMQQHSGEHICSGLICERFHCDNVGFHMGADVVTIDFNADMPGIEKEVERIMNLWIEAGVTIFRIDNPHTKPVRFWQDVIAAVTKKHPEILFLAEAFTRPGMMRALSYVGFTQSHCYFPWRNTKDELEEYLPVTNGDDGYYQHNTFWPTTPDILTAYVRDNGVAGHCVRAVLAAMGSPSWGIYNGYELIENKQRPGFEEQIDNEKYEVKVRDWSKAKQYGVAEMLTALNKIRRAHPAALSYHNLTVLPTSDPNILAFARHTPAELTGTGQADTLIVVVNLDGHNAHQSMIHLELSELGLPTDRPLNVRDELTGREFQWGWDNYVSLAPWADVAHILSVQ